MLISLRVNHKVTTFPSGLTLQYPQSPCRRRRVLFSWDSWNLRRASWPEWSVLRPGIRIEKLDFTINSVISSDTGQGNDAPRTERALCFRPNEPKIKKEPERVPEARCDYYKIKSLPHLDNLDRPSTPPGEHFLRHSRPKRSKSCPEVNVVRRGEFFGI